jgi:hypothetical protein
MVRVSSLGGGEGEIRKNQKPNIKNQRQKYKNFKIIKKLK